MPYRLPRPLETARLAPVYSTSVILLLVCLPCSAQELKLTMLHESAELYGKVEFRIGLDREYANPFDQAEVNLTLLVETPSKKRVAVPAFYFQPCEHRTLERSRGSQQWIYPTGEPQWRARFAPEEVGTYRASAQLTDRVGTVYSERVSFAATGSENPGFLKTDSEDARYFAFDNGDPFFAIGQNLAFIGPGQPMTLSRAQSAFEKLAQNGANFVRIWTGCQDWALAIESPRSAWGRSWSRNESIVDLPGHDGKKAVRIGGADSGKVTAAPYDAIPVRPNTEYTLAGNLTFDGPSGLRIVPARSEDNSFVVHPNGDSGQSFRHSFRTTEGQFHLDRITLTAMGNGVIWLTDLSLKEAKGGPELLCDADPNPPRRGIYHQIDAFMLDQLVESARENRIYLQLCVTMRDLYMHALKDPKSDDYEQAVRDAQNLMRYFVARWGYSTSVAAWEYFNEMNPGQPTDRFYIELAEYLDRVDPYGHLRTTSTWSTSHRDWRHPGLDIAEEHHYLRPSTLEKTPDVVAAVLDRAKDLREHARNRPMLLAEFGLADEKWGLSPRMREDGRLEHFHNALWASAHSGLSGTAMFWWWEQLDRREAYHHYKPLADYLRTVPFVSGKLEPGDVEVAGPRELIALALKGPRHACFWLYDRQTSWERQGSQESADKPDVNGAAVRLTGLEPGSYAVDWWDTWNGRIILRDVATVSEDPVELPVPPFAHDIACQITPTE